MRWLEGRQAEGGSVETGWDVAEDAEKRSEVEFIKKEHIVVLMFHMY